MYFSSRIGARLIRECFARLRKRFRRMRYQRLVDLLGLCSTEYFVLDLGGGRASFFAEQFPKPERVVLLDINYQFALQAKHHCPGIHIVVGDGERLPLADRSVGATVCNSVVEHISHPEKLAGEIRRVSRAYFVQTPAGTFPIETHSFIAIPFYHMIPWEWLRKLVCQVLGARFEYICNVRYLSENQLIQLFPEATLEYEKVLGMVKSFYVYYVAPGVEACKEAQGDNPPS